MSQPDQRLASQIHAFAAALAQAGANVIDLSHDRLSLDLTPQEWRLKRTESAYSLSIRRTCELGFSLEEVRTLLALTADEGRSCAEVDERASRQLAAVDRKIADLQALNRELVVVLESCAGGTGRREPGDRGFLSILTKTLQPNCRSGTWQVNECPLLARRCGRGASAVGSSLPEADRRDPTQVSPFSRTRLNVRLRRNLPLVYF